MSTAGSAQARSGLVGRPARRGFVLAGGWAVAAAGVTTALLRDPQVRPYRTISWLVLAAAILCADLMAIELSSRRVSLRLDMSAIPVAVGTVLTPARGVLQAALLASAAAVLVRWRHRERALIGAVIQVAAVGSTELLVWLLLGGRVPTPAGGLVAVAVGLAAYQLVIVVGAVTYAGTCSGTPRWWSVPRPLAVQAGLVLAYNTVLGVLAVSIGLRDVWGLILLAAPAAFFGLWYRSVNGIQRRYQNMQMLYGFTAQLADLPDSEAIVSAALALCRELLLCRQAHLVLQEPGRAARWEIPDVGRGARVIGATTATVPPLLPPAERHRPGGLKDRLRDLAPQRSGGADVMTAPVAVGDSEPALLVVADHSVPGESFDRSDLQLFEALSAHLSTALTSTRRLEQLRSEVAAREHQALHDALTGLANRTLFSHWVADELERAAAGRHVAVMVMDLDGFKDINDSLGHQSGDQVLQEVAVRLERLTTPTCRAARLGGDEFAFLLSDLATPEGAMGTASGISEEISRPVSLGGMPLELRASIGIAVAAPGSSDPVTLLQRADVAMYSAKASKRSSVVYDPEMERGTRRRLTLGSTLRQALDSGRIEVWYQPIARSATGWISGCEALLRWRDGEGFIPPSEFIPVAEHTGMIERLTWWTLDSALAELHAWREEGICPSVAVNLSTRVLQAPDVLQRVREPLIRSDIPPSELTLEITESLLMSDPDLAEDLLNQLGAMGVRIAIDDFGTGYSSLSRLKRLPVHTIKIDREFVTNMHADRDDEAIVKATLELARTLGCVVVAEGVETFEAWHRLQAFGCQQVQGFILAEPMPASDCRRWLRQRRYLSTDPAAEPA